MHPTPSPTVRHGLSPTHLAPLRDPEYERAGFLIAHDDTIIDIWPAPCELPNRTATASDDTSG